LEQILQINKGEGEEDLSQRKYLEINNEWVPVFTGMTFCVNEVLIISKKVFL